MSKFSEFYAKASTDETTRKKLAAILGEKSITDAGEEALIKIGSLARELGYEISLDEAKKYLRGNEEDLDEEDLDAVAGGKTYTIGDGKCDGCVGSISLTI